MVSMNRSFSLSNHSEGDVIAVAWGCPDLREVGIIDSTRVSTLPGACRRLAFTPSQTDSKAIKELRRLEYLAVADVELEEVMDHEPANTAGREKGRKVWKRELINLL